MDYLPKIEWELLHEAILLKDFELKTDLGLNSIKSICLKRNENYEILLEILGTESLNNIQEFNEQIDIEIETKEDYFCLKKCTNLTSNHSIGKENKYKYEFKVNLVEKFSKKFLKNKPSFIKEWYLNSVRNTLLFKRDTRFNYDNCIKIRDIPKNQKINLSPLNKKIRSIDSLFIELETFSFLLENVPKAFKPFWSNKLSIEYQKDFKIPNIKTRRQIIEILSFLFGKYLIKVGETCYDKNWNIIYQNSNSPKISSKINLKTNCSLRDEPAIYFNEDFPELFNLEEILSEIISSYLLEVEINLSDMIEQLMLSTTLPTESEIIVIGACLDNLTKEWFDSNKTKNNGLLISKKEFNKLMKKEMENIKNNLKDYPDILTNIENAYKLSGRKKVDSFLEELDLEIGKSEEKAREYRNIPAHGQKMSYKTHLKMIYLTLIYRTLLNRIILKILGYNEYYDLTTGKPLPITNKIPEKDFEEIINYIEEFSNDY